MDLLSAIPVEFALDSAVESTLGSESAAAGPSGSLPPPTGRGGPGAAGAGAAGGPAAVGSTSLDAGGS